MDAGRFIDLTWEEMRQIEFALTRRLDDPLLQPELKPRIENLIKRIVELQAPPFDWSSRE